MKISDIKDIDVLKKMFQNASDMQERSVLRSAIQALREQEMNKLVPHGDLNLTGSMRRSRRTRGNQAPRSVTLKADTTPFETRKLHVGRSPEENFKTIDVGQASSELPEKTDIVFDSTPDRPQAFIRNSSIRRNRRSRKSTSSRSSDVDSGVCKPSSTEVFSPVDQPAVIHSEQHPTARSVIREETASFITRASTLSHSSENREVLPSGSNQIRNSIESRKYFSKENESPGISPYRSPSSNHKQSVETPKRTSVSVNRGATCQYKTITTSFRGPAWNPVSSNNTTPLRRQHINNSSNRAYSTSEWPERDRGPSSGTGPDKRHSSCTETSDYSGSGNHQKNPARVVLKALGKKLFSTKGKTPSASGQQISPSHHPNTDTRCESVPRPVVYPQTPKYSQFSTPKSQNSVRLSPFLQRKKVFEKGTAESKTPSNVSYSWNQPRATRNDMADVAPLSRPSSREPGNFSPAITATSATKPDMEEESVSAIGELEGLLKQYTEPEDRVKIRETIRRLKQSLQEGDSSPSEAKATNKSVFSNSSEYSPQQHEQDGAVEFTVELQKSSGSSSISRFSGRSTSLRTSKPPYQPSPQAVNRASSFKLSRPKDFIAKKVGSFSQLSKVPETPPQDFKQYADSLNNNIPDFKAKSASQFSSSFTHNKTASPFSFSPQGSYKKHSWTPPSTSVGQSKPGFTTTPLPATARSSAASSGLRRSESTKENRSTGFQPVGVVPGNLRRSKSILERILGQKVDAEKSPSTPFQPSIAREEKQHSNSSVSKIDVTFEKFEQRPPSCTPPKRESPILTPIPKAAPRNKTPPKAVTPTSALRTKAPSPLAREIKRQPYKEEKVEISPRISSRSSSATSCSSSSGSNSSGDHVYEIAESDSELSSSESSHCLESPTLSEIIRESRKQDDNETATEEHSSSVVQSAELDKNEDLESEDVFEETEKLGEDTDKETSKPGSDNRKLLRKAAPRIVLQPLTAHEVFQHETARVFNVQVVRPIGVRSKSQTQGNPAPAEPLTQNKLPAQNKGVTQINKEAKKSSSSLSSISSSSDCEEELLSDDEESSTDERDMDRFSSRALQSRVSVKSQVMAKEDSVNGNTKASSDTVSKRLRDRHNKPLTSGVDLKTRMQKFKGQTNGDTEKAPVSKRNGSVKITAPSGKKLDLSKFENDRDKDPKISSFADKTTVTIKTSGTRSTRRSTSREETFEIKLDAESLKENVNGSTKRAENEIETRKVSSGSSADDSSGRIRRARRGKIGSEAENGLDKLEKASSRSTDELKQLGKSSSSCGEVVVTSKKSRDRAKKVKEDVNNNERSADVAPSNENTEFAIEDSLSSWSARRRKRREKRDTSSSATSSTENEKSSEDLGALDKEEEKEIIQRTKTKLHVTHSSPALSEVGSLRGYTFKLSLSGEKMSPSRKEEILLEKEEVIESQEDEVEASKVETRRSRYSRTESSTTNEDTEVSPTSKGDELQTFTAGDGTEIVMEFSSEKAIVISDSNEDVQTDTVDAETAENEIELEETTEVDEQQEGKDNEEESDDVDSHDVNASGTPVDSDHDRVDVDDKENVENKSRSDGEQKQTIDDDTAQTSAYKGESAETRSLSESPDEEKSVESERLIEPEPDKPSRRRNRKEQKASSIDETEQVRPTPRRNRRKEVEKVEEPAEERPKRRNRERKAEEETSVQEKKVLEEKGEEERKETSKEPAVEAEQTTASQKEPPTETKTESDQKPEAEESSKAMQLSIENIEEITDIDVLQKMLGVASEYDERRRIRSVIRALKRGEKPKLVKDPKYEAKSNGSLRALDLSSKRTEVATSDASKNRSLAQEGTKGSRTISTRTTVTEVEKTDRGTRFSSTTVSKTTRMTSGQKKIGSIFDRGDDEDEKPKSRGSSRLSDLERRQAERKRELQRNRSMPASSSSKDARKAFVAKLEAGGPKTTPGKKVGRSPTFVVPNANNVKQLLLKWCQSKTRGYEHVDIMNFSSSWASGMAFCALVHNFFPDAFDYSKLDPKNKAENLELAFTKADEHGEIPQLLDTEDMICMAEPDWKCVYTYIGEFYKRIRDLGLN